MQAGWLFAFQRSLRQVFGKWPLRLESGIDACYNSPIMKSGFIKLISAVFTSFLFMQIIVSAQTWAGTYNFDEDGGKTAGGTPIFVTHSLVVLESDGGYYATLKSNGYQTSRDLICQGKTEGNKLKIYFVSYGEDNIFELYRPDDLLLTLERRPSPKGEQILTFWGKFLPIVPKNEKTGRIYFVRQDEINLQ